MAGYRNKVSQLAWKNFENTGKISFYLLYNAIENPERTNYRLRDSNINNSNNKNMELKTWIKKKI